MRQESIARAALVGLCSLTALGCKSAADSPATGAASKTTVEPPPSASATNPHGACTPGKTGRIACLLKQQTAFRYLNADVPFFQETVEAAGFKVVFQSGENDPKTQVSQAENTITRGVDAIVIQPVDFNVAGTIAKMATEAKIPLASYDDVIMNASHAAFIGRDPKEGGIAAATAVVAAIPKGNYALIGGDPGQTGLGRDRRPGHGALGRAGDRRRQDVRYVVARPRRDGRASRQSRRRSGPLRDAPDRCNGQQRRRRRTLGENAHLPDYRQGNARVCVRASVLAKARRRV